MNENLKPINEIVTEYFNSVNDLFAYRLRNQWKINLSSFLFALSIFFLILNIVPIIPGNVDNYLQSVFLYLKDHTALPLNENSFWIKWILGTIVALVICGVTFCFMKYWSTKEKKNALSQSLMNFCYTYSIGKEIRSYLMNERPEHLKKATKYYNEINSTFQKINIVNDDKALFINVSKLYELINKKFKWFEISDATKQIIDTIGLIDIKILQRLEQAIDLESIIPAIDNLILFEFSKIKPDELDADGIPFSKKREEHLKQFYFQVGNLVMIEVSENVLVKKNKIIAFVNSTITLFTSGNILTLFLSWLVLLTLLFVTVSAIIMNVFKLKFDSTIMIGVLSTSFLGAITMCATIYTKNKKQ